MAARTTSHTEQAHPDGGLSTPRIVAVAVWIADTHGLDALSMRQVAAELGVATMSLYHHVRGRDELVEQMVEAVFREDTDAAHGEGSTVRHDVNLSGADWRDELEAWTRREWRLLSRHRWLLRVITDFPPLLPPGLLADVERVLAALVDAGLDPITAHQAFQSASGLVEGLALLQAGTDRADRRGLTHRWRTTEVPAILERTGAKNYPLQAGLITSLDAALDVDRMLEFGLARLLDGIAHHLTSRAAEGIG
ncbi:TetR/AcrR family transcriptional regulator [Actinoalloteichus sp. GBA129-24]|uniref:TetR/AcrR family transcriptional regulator n=1 Tax=Actinoalloteichus sp. GBA129-24 TaxID=1612551 RepID=UPI0009509526|nr:TetR/AcrR family transcriptional regulator [Actinoalloteichus sp. GBA129-24]APU22471.1 transcriptional regulator, TetR family [Actinoalloteichus sp. GBA129-24]